ncbi:MAG TPA: hypothetical protein DEF89_24250 [Desulfosporosinus sp.]|nr:hypothetical protein [Desulfosporosinus sp.]
MTERLNNDQITQRIMDTNSDLKRYLNLAPSFNITPSTPKPSSSSKAFGSHQPLPLRPPLRP